MNSEKPDRQAVIDAVMDALANPEADSSAQILEQWRNETPASSSAPVMAENCNKPAEL